MRTKIGLSRFLRSKDKSFTASNSSTSSINEGSVNGSSVGDLTPEPVLSFPDGVQQLYTCTDATVDICFVHGLTGNRTSTWTARGAVEPWIKTLLPGVIDKARILTYGYDAYPMSKSVASSNRLIDHASNLLNDITMNRTNHGSNQRPLIFVAHSLGGPVCKKALLQSRHHPEAHLRDVFNSTKGVIFMGTPHKGAWMAKWGNISATALGLVKSTNTSLLEILETDNQLLESIQVDFVSMVRELRESGRNLEITCFFEELPLRGIGLVVPKDSAQLPGHNSLSIHADHSSMVKFSSAEENGFQLVVGELKRWQLSAR
ncbi:hypothetical protein K456DRAFT_951639 [Colletotrichum gloeosporioides 23]|nr:hypothetical protein K456DRAFT_951639 [Colletotrichum gloeosporioides 23]